MKIRYALRSIKKDPLLAAIAILSLGLGIGANTAIFSLIDQLLLRMLPVENPQQLVQLAARGPHYGSNWGMNAMSYPMYRDFRDKATVFSGVLARFSTQLSLGYNGQTELVKGELVTGNYFQLLGVRPAIGRTFTPEDDVRPNESPLATITYDFWQARFAGDPNIIGKTVHLNGYPVTVIGVSPPRFHGVEIGEATQVFVPMMMHKQMAPQLSRFYDIENRRGRWANVFARLKPGVTIEQAKAALAPLYKQIIEMEVQEPAFAKASDYARQRFLSSRMEVFDGSTGRSYLREGFTKPLYVLMAITGLVLLIACANVANLLIARATARQKEIAVRLALGASRAQIVGQLMVESLLLSVAGGVVGLGLGLWIDRFLLNFLPPQTSQLTITANLDSRVLWFSLAVAFVTAFIFGLIPALQATRPHLFETLKNEAGSVLGGSGHARFRKALVIAQVSLSLLLLIASSLFVRSLAKLHQLDPGFRIDRLITFALDPTLNGYDGPRTAQFYRDLMDRLKALPGVESAGHAVIRVLDGSEWDSSITVEGYKAQQSENMNPHFNAVSVGYFATMGMPVVAGRDFTIQDVRSDPKTGFKVCIVNETLARKYFPNADAVGHHIGQGSDPGTKTEIEIVGVIRDAKYDNMRDTIPRQVFLPFSQVDAASGTAAYVRTTQAPSAFFGTVRALIHEMDPNLPVHSMRTLQDQVDRNLITERMIASLSSAFGLVATILAVVGLYGVMSFTVARREREIGIRMTLGAEPRSVLMMIMREAGILLVIGVAIAIPAYIGLASYIRSQLYGIDATDPLSIGFAAALLLIIGIIAGYIPSRRAVRVDPIQVLRYE